MGETPKKKNKVNDEDESKSINEFAQKAYESITMKATQDLMTFLSTIEPEARCVTYFDEAHDLDKALWVLLRLVQYQKPWIIYLSERSQASPMMHRMQATVRTLSYVYSFGLSINQCLH